MFESIENIWYKKRERYYIEVVRNWNYTSYDSYLKCMTHAHPIFLIKKRNLFKRDNIISQLWYTNKIEDALDYVRALNNFDFINNEEAYKKYKVCQRFDKDNNSGIYVSER